MATEPCKLAAFIDEAGCEGGEFGKGGSEWFVLSAIVFKEPSQGYLDERVAQIRSAAGPNKRLLKFSKLSTKSKIRACEIVGSMACRIASVAVHKPSLTGQLNSDLGRFYRYISMMLIERISWICRDTTSPGIPSITFSRRAGFEYSKIAEYARKVKSNADYFKSKCAWEFIDPDSICAVDHSDSSGCLLADIAASSMFLAIERTEYSITDSRPLVQLKRVYYRGLKSDCAFGTGIKVFPDATESVLAEYRFDWARHYFGFTENQTPP